jgi:hypothetical protein
MTRNPGDQEGRETASEDEALIDRISQAIKVQRRLGGRSQLKAMRKQQGLLLNIAEVTPQPRRGSRGYSCFHGFLIQVSAGVSFRERNECQG